MGGFGSCREDLGLIWVCPISLTVVGNFFSSTRFGLGRLSSTSSSSSDQGKIRFGEDPKYWDRVGEAERAMKLLE